MNKKPEPYQLEPWREELLARAFERLPHDYDSLSPALSALRKAFHLNLAEVLQPAINAHVAAMSDSNWRSYDQRAAFVDSATHRLGLAVSDPNTGRAAILATQVYQGSKRMGAHFTYYIRAGRDGYNLSSSSSELAPIKLQPASAEFDSWAEEFRSKPSRHR